MNNDTHLHVGRRESSGCVDPTPGQILSDGHRDGLGINSRAPHLSWCSAACCRHTRPNEGGKLKYVDMSVFISESESPHRGEREGGGEGRDIRLFLSA